MKTKLPKVIEWRFDQRERPAARGEHSDRAGKRPGKRPGWIRVDPRQTPRDRCETLIHETIHEVCPYLEEWVVQELGDTIEQILNRDGYRRIYHAAKIPK
jgi:hypothetical protein